MVNGVDVDVVKETCDLMRSDPDLAKAKFRIENMWKSAGHNQVHVKGYYAGGEEKDHQSSFDFKVDEPPVLAGSDIGPSPVEYLLTALSGCMTTTIVYYAALNGIKISSLKSEFDGDLDMRGFLNLSDKVPKGYQRIRARFEVEMDDSIDKLEEFYQFSPVYSMISASVPIDVEFIKK